MPTKNTKRVTKPRTSKTIKTTKRVAASETANYESFKLAANPKDFFTFQPTIQTVYWLIIGGLVIALAAWALTLQLQILAIYDQVDSNTEDITTIKTNRSTMHLQQRQVQ